MFNESAISINKSNGNVLHGEGEVMAIYRDYFSANLLEVTTTYSAINAAGSSKWK